MEGSKHSKKRKKGGSNSSSRYDRRKKKSWIDESDSSSRYDSSSADDISRKRKCSDIEMHAERKQKRHVERLDKKSNLKGNSSCMQKKTALSRAYIEFKLGKRFKDAKIWSCKVYADDGEKLRSAQYFCDREKAKRYVQVLEKFERNPHIVKYYYYFYDKDNEAGQPKAGFLVFTEPVISFDTWLDNPKIKMWAYNSSKTRIVGMGEDFINIFGQLGIVLKQVAQARLPNGNLSKGGFMVGERDGQVRLCNFNMDDEGSSGELERYHADLTDFRYLIDLAVERHPPDVPFRGGVDPIYEFNRLCDADVDLLNYDLRKFLNSSRWMYRAIVFWDPREQRTFFSKFQEFVDINSSSFQRSGFMTKHFKNWVEVLREDGTEDMIRCYNYGLLPPCYEFACGLLRFLRNYIEHRAKILSKQDAFDVVIEKFPRLAYLVYKELFRILRTRTFSYSGWLQNIKFDTYIWEHTDIFEKSGQEI